MVLKFRNFKYGVDMLKSLSKHTRDQRTQAVK